MDRGWVKNYRKEIDWEWFKDPPTAHLFHYLVLAANRKPTRYKGVDIPVGGLTTSRSALAEATGLSERQVRTALKHLISTNEVTSRTTAKYTLLIVNNYALYQGSDQVSDQQVTSKRPSSDQQVTTNKNIRKKEVKKKEEKLMSSDEDESPSFSPEIEEIIGYLNRRTGRKFSPKTAESQKSISARLRDGYTVDDFKKVIDTKTAEWGNDPKMRKYLDPSTLFRPGNFEKYLNQGTWQPEGQSLDEMQAQYGGHWV